MAHDDVRPRVERESILDDTWHQKRWMFFETMPAGVAEEPGCFPEGDGLSVFGLVQFSLFLTSTCHGIKGPGGAASDGRRIVTATYIALIDDVTDENAGMTLISGR